VRSFADGDAVSSRVLNRTIRADSWWDTKRHTIAIPRFPAQMLREHLRSRGESYQAIADTLNESGVERGQSGARRHASTVHYLAQKPA
jgi:hypothetical protein